MSKSVDICDLEFCSIADPTYSLRLILKMVMSVPPRCLAVSPQIKRSTFFEQSLAAFVLFKTISFRNKL